ncbi:MAG TPA: ABC transporter ATP-binding protein [Thermoanaerobaculia bacterium]|nr:ABC transporter ATP-binding protein [Thermoanaerobaculia bacterium]
MPETPTTCSFANVSKVYRHYAAPRDRLFEALTGRARHVEVHALSGVTGSIEKGAVLGVIGENGSGKSTLFRILAGTTAATSGTVSLPGRIASILELGSAFHPDDTGRRNVILQAALAGLSRDEVADALPEIEAFAELGDFFDRPVKTYSSGMQMRLAFSVATAVLPDVVILDEALAVGDGHFQKKCVDRIFELKASGRTIFFCSHAMYYVSTLCDRALWLNAGRVEAEGDSQSVVLEYERFLARKERAVAPHAAGAVVPAGTHGRFLDVVVTGGDGLAKEEFRPGEPWAVELEFASDAPSRPLQIHLAVSTRDNVVCFSADSRLDGAGPFVGRSVYRVRVGVDALPLGKGEFVVYAYLADEKALALFDARSDRTFRVETETWHSGLMSLPATWSAVSPKVPRP